MEPREVKTENQPLARPAWFVTALRAAQQLGKTPEAIGNELQIDPRTLRKLMRGLNARLEVSQLEALHEYLAALGHPILHYPTLGRAIGESHGIEIMIPAYKDADDHHRRVCSPWDIWAAVRLRNRAQVFDCGRHVVLKQQPREAPPDLDKFAEEPRTSRIAIGSPRATKAFGAFCDRFANARSKPAVPSPKKFQLALPVKFHWRDHATPGPYEAGADELEPWKNERDFRDARAALLFSDRKTPPLVEISNLNRKGRTKFHSYALVVAKARPNESVWACIAGLTGPATEAAASRFFDLDFCWNVNRNGEPVPSAFLYVIQVTIKVAEVNAEDDLRSWEESAVQVLRTYPLQA